jgi:hypothetical protein
MDPAKPPDGLEAKLKGIIGDLVFQIAALQVQLETAKQTIERLEVERKESP